MRGHSTMQRRVSVALATAVCLVIPAAAEHAEVFRGQVAFDTNPNGEIVVALDVAGGEVDVDGAADHLFFLQQDSPFTQLTAALPAVEVVFKDRQLLIRSLEGSRAWIFSVPGETDRLTRAIGHLKHTGYAKVKTVQGFGLSHYVGPFAADDAAIDLAGLMLIPERFFFDPFQDAASPFDKPGYDPHSEPGGGGSSFCSSGGPGSTSCSVSSCSSGSPRSCSTSCTSPRYACCNCNTSGAGCRCK